MAWGEIALLELRRPNGEAARRWCSHYRRQTVTWGGYQWEWHQFEWGALESGAAGAGGSSVSVPMTQEHEQLWTRAMRERWLVILRVFVFDEEAGASTLPADAAQVAGDVGLIVGGSDSSEPPVMTWKLGADDSGSFPPLLAGSFLIGTPCVLT